MDIAREVRTMLGTALTTVSTTGTVIDYSGCASGEVILPATAAVTLTWYTCGTPDGTFIAAYDSAGAAVAQTVVQSRAYPFPVALLGCKYLKVTSDVAVTVDIVMKT